MTGAPPVVRRLLASLLTGLAVAGVLGCPRRPPPPAPTASEAPTAPTTTLAVPGVPLRLPLPRGWFPDPSVGGKGDKVVLRLLQKDGVPGAPRIEVTLTPSTARPALLEELLTHNLQEMAALEQSGALHLGPVEQRRRDVGGCKLYQVQQQYTLLSPAGPVVVEQLAALLVLQGRGVVITAAGRAELYAPHRATIEAFFAGLQLSDAQAPTDLGALGAKPH